MKSIRNLYIIGQGPSSSHTMGPVFACEHMLKKYPDMRHITVNLYGSLALTGKGHLTGLAIEATLKHVYHDIFFDKRTPQDHPNTIIFEIDTEHGHFIEKVISVGGGSIKILSEDEVEDKPIYNFRNFEEILEFCRNNDLKLVDFIIQYEDNEILNYIEKVYQTMTVCRDKGLQKTGKLPGGLHVVRKAKLIAEKCKDDDIEMKVAAASFAVAEENSVGGVVAIAPTAGSAGLVPGVLTYLELENVSHEDILNGLLVGGLIGMIAKTNASVSGAECGCQAEIGVACAMGAAIICAAKGCSNEIIASAAEIAIEHSLGLTCDPVHGYVQIPCIERCAIYALKAISAAKLASILPIGESRVSFDQSLKTMYVTGKDLQPGYKETAKKGLAEVIK